MKVVHKRRKLTYEEFLIKLFPDGIPEIGATSYIRRQWWKYQRYLNENKT